MKKLFLSLIIMVSAMALSAQKFQVLYEGAAIESGQTYYVYGDGSASWGEPGGELLIEFYVTALEDVRLIGEKVENNVVSGTFNYLCFGNCYSSSIYVTPPVVLSPSGNPELFSMHFQAEEDYTAVAGQEQSMTYYIYPADATDDKFVINVIFKYSLDNTADLASTAMFSEAYPMPASNVVNFDYDLPASTNNAMLVIYNMMGQEVIRHDISGISGKASINVSDLNDGIYFYSFVINGKTEKSSKIVVRK